MNNKVLVAYATKYGATAEIAEKIGQTLRSAGLQVDVVPANKVGNPGAYDAVVLGSAVYVGGWRKEAVAFLEANEAALKTRPVWFFSSGPTGEGDQSAPHTNLTHNESVRLASRRCQPDVVAQISRSAR
ncbi:MAG: flavodoxin domain-containing protein [Chloroflexi bacterium]|nr:flavodoxin domain-containing protein [Chloroflexota bacterium]MCL5275536.1 flavodoxin domain-containing protein [Chloroflexota bacterium]